MLDGRSVTRGGRRVTSPRSGTRSCVAWTTTWVWRATLGRALGMILTCSRCAARRSGPRMLQPCTALHGRCSTTMKTLYDWCHRYLCSFPPTHMGARLCSSAVQVGNKPLSHVEQRAHFALWAVMKSPLLIGTDLRTASPEVCPAPPRIPCTRCMQGLLAAHMSCLLTWPAISASLLARS